jgi:hypothetical protein
MNKKLLTVVIASTFFTMALLPIASNAGNGRRGGQCLRNKTAATQQLQGCQQLRDGSCLKSGTSGAGTAQQKGKNYGPGDGTGNQGDRPQDGTGYGATANK